MESADQPNKLNAIVRKTDYWGDYSPDYNLRLFLFNRGRKWDAPTNAIEIDANELGVNAQEQAEEQMRLLWQRLKHIQFAPLVIQLSHFGVSEPTVEGFVAAIYTESDLYKTYYNTITQNVESPEHGPIGPSAGLYSRPFWHSHIATSSASKNNSIAKPSARFAGYKLVHERAANNAETVATFIKSFHERIAANYEGQSTLSASAGDVTDFVIIPFVRLLANNINADSDYKQQGGAFFALGRFVDDYAPNATVAGEIDRVFDALQTELEATSSPGFQVPLDKAKDDLNKSLAQITTLESDLDKAILSLRRDLETEITNEVGRKYAKTQSELAEALLRRGADHETKDFAWQIETKLRQQQEILKQPTCSSADVECLVALTSFTDKLVKQMGHTMRCLIEPVQDRGDISADRLYEAFLLAVCNMRHMKDMYLWEEKHKQPGDKINEFLLSHAQECEQYDDFKVLSDKIAGDVGKCSIAMKNLLDNAIKGCGDIYEPGKMIRQRTGSTFIRNSFEMTVERTTNGIMIKNTAILNSETYDRSYSKSIVTSGPMGVYMPDSSSTGTPRYFSYKGGRLAQALLEIYGYEIELARWLQDGQHKGTITIIRRRNGYGRDQHSDVR